MNFQGGEPVDSLGNSKLPGNINSLLLKLPEYADQLEKFKGCISEFINPKYKGSVIYIRLSNQLPDSTKTTFSSPARLECMMQDYPKAIPYNRRVAVTIIDSKFCFSALKNNLKTAQDKAKQNLSPECALTCNKSIFFHL